MPSGSLRAQLRAPKPSSSTLPPSRRPARTTSSAFPPLQMSARSTASPKPRYSLSLGVDLELTDKVAVVTGASKGIGLAVAQELAAEGAKVVAGARHLESLPDVDGVIPLAVDLADPGGPEGLVGYAVDKLGRVDV